MSCLVGMWPLGLRQLHGRVMERELAVRWHSFSARRSGATKLCEFINSKGRSAKCHCAHSSNKDFLALADFRVMIKLPYALCRMLCAILKNHATPQRKLAQFITSPFEAVTLHTLLRQIFHCSLSFGVTRL